MNIILEKLDQLISTKLEMFQKELDSITKYDARATDDMVTGRLFNDIIDRYAITREELLSISETVAKFVTYTRFTDIDRYLFKDKELTEPIIKRKRD